MTPSQNIGASVRTAAASARCIPQTLGSGGDVIIATAMIPKTIA
jgi:hypothetical protein